MQTLISKIESFGIPPNDLSEKSGVYLDKIIAILQGNIEPSLSDIRKIAKALRVSPNLLINENTEIPALGVLFRKSFQDSDQPKINRLSYILNNTLSLLENYEVKNDAFGKFPQVENKYDGARQLAEIFREQFFDTDFVSPILELPSIIADKLNCIVLVYELGNGTDGASIIFQGIPFIIVCPRFIPRMFFTLAHELGHILAHHNEQSFAIIDNANIPTRKKKFDDEAFAHAFASELLMPQEGVGFTLKTIRSALNIEGDYVGEIELLYLSRAYGVSFETAVLRCENLGLVPIGTAISMYESLSKEYKSPELRAKQLGIPERENINFPKVSSNLLNTVIEKIKSGKLSLENASELLSVSAIDIINYNSLQE